MERNSIRENKVGTFENIVKLNFTSARGVAWSSSQRRSLSLQGSRDRIPVFLSFDQRFRLFVYSIVIRSINTFHVANDLRRKARPARRGRKTGRRFRNGCEKGVLSIPFKDGMKKLEGIVIDI